MRRLLGVVCFVLLVVPATAQTPDPDLTTTSKFVLIARGESTIIGGTPRLLLDLKTGRASKFRFGHGSASLILAGGDRRKTARGCACFPHAEIWVRLTFRLAEPDADGSRAVTGRGRITTGYGSTNLTFGKARGRFKVSGSQSATGRVRLRLAGTIRYIQIPASGRGH